MVGRPQPTLLMLGSWVREICLLDPGKGRAAKRPVGAKLTYARTFVESALQPQVLSRRAENYS